MLRRSHDSIKLRLAAVIVVAIAVTIGLRSLTTLFGGVLARPPIERVDVMEQVIIAVRLLDAAPAAARPAMAAAMGAAAVAVDWYPGSAPPAPAIAGTDTDGDDDDWAIALARGLLKDPDRPILLFTSADDASRASTLRYDRQANPHAYFMELPLTDGSWVVFSTTPRVWGLGRVGQGLVLVACLGIAVALVSTIATRGLSRPIARFAAAAQRFGVDPQATPIDETGPRELRVATAAFNAMQARIQRFVADRTLLLAAMSHDLRTPLTRMRLRAEFIDDPEQQARLIRDVDEMQAMIDAALAFSRDAQTEPHTTFDLAELLRTVADDCADLGHVVPYSGPDRATFLGRPAALKRAFTNLVDNALKYGTDPAIELTAGSGTVTVAVTDRGPGIPAADREQVFRPFFRLESSRNRLIGGIGLGLATARSIVRAHGGDITLEDRRPGLAALVSLPHPAPP